METSNIQPAFGRIKTVAVFTDTSESAAYLMVQREDFPKPIRLGAKLVLWNLAEVAQWVLLQRDAANDTSASPKRERVKRKA